MMEAGWFAVPAVAVVLVFVIGSWLALRGDSAAADRVASVGFWAACGVGGLLLVWMLADRGLT